MFTRLSSDLPSAFAPKFLTLNSVPLASLRTARMNTRDNVALTRNFESMVASFFVSLLLCTS